MHTRCAIERCHDAHRGLLCGRIEFKLRRCEELRLRVLSSVDMWTARFARSGYSSRSREPGVPLPEPVLACWAESWVCVLTPRQRRIRRRHTAALILLSVATAPPRATDGGNKDGTAHH